MEQSSLVIIELVSEVSGGRSRPKILPLPNGQYYLINNMEPKIVQNLQNSEGEPLSSIAGFVLCRCVEPKKTNPPVTGLSVIGFSSKNKTDGKQDRRISYFGKKITVHDDRMICSHAAHCVENLPTVFKLKTNLGLTLMRMRCNSSSIPYASVLQGPSVILLMM